MGLTGLALFGVAFFAVAWTAVDHSGARVDRLADGRVVSVGKSWPGPFDRCVIDIQQPVLPNCYREPIALDSVVKQPVSSASALGYSVVGLLILWWAAAPRSATFGREYQFWLGAVAVAMGPGSILFHGTLTAWGGWFDQMSMYLLLSFVVAYNIVTLKRATLRLFIGLFTLAIVLTGTAAAITGDASLVIFIVSAVGVAVLELVVCSRLLRGVELKRSGGLLSVVFVILLVALVPWLASGPSGGPPTEFPFHSLWHVASAAFVGGYYVYLRSQTPLRPRLR
jgi:hypothetical protein